MQTLKLKYHIDSKQLEEIYSYQKQYTNLLRFMYNRVCDGKLEKQCEQKAKLLNNLDLLDSWFIRSAAKQAKWINDTNKDKTVVFGGRKNLRRRAKGLITKEEFLAKRLQPINSIAQSLEELGKDLVFSSLRELYYTLKKSKFRYRLSLDDVVHPMFSRYFSQRSLILKYCV